MKAISIHADYAYDIANNIKTIETRSWPTNYRGEILICSTVAGKNKTTSKSFIFGNAIAVATLKDCKPFTREDRKKALVHWSTNMQGMYSWHLTNIKPIKPIPVKGQQRIYNVNIDPSDIEYLDLKPRQSLRKYWQQYNYL